MTGLLTPAPGGQNGGLGLRREVPGCVDPSSAPPSHWKQETAETLGLNFRSQAAPLLQVVRGPSGQCAPECGTSSCGDFLVVVHGNCIVEYSKGERLTVHPAVTPGGQVDWPCPPLPPPRVPACGQEAESITEPDSSGKSPVGPTQPVGRPFHRTTPPSTDPKLPLNIPLLGPPRLPLPSYSDVSARRPTEGDFSPSREAVEQQKGVRAERRKLTLEPVTHGVSDLQASTAARLTPVPIGRSCNGLGFQVTAVGPGGGAAVGGIWDHRACPLLAEGDVIVKANGADLRHLPAGRVQEVLQQHTLEGDMVLLVQREVLRASDACAAPTSDVASTRLSHANSHRPPLLHTATDDGAAPRRIHAGPLSPDTSNRGPGQRHRCMGAGVSIGPPVAAQGKGCTKETPRTQPPQGDQDHHRGKKPWPQRGITAMARPTRLLPEAFEGWAAQDDAVKATSFMEPVPCDLQLGQRCLLQSLADLRSQPSHKYREATGPGAAAHSTASEPATDQAAGPPLASRLTEVALERVEDEGFGFVIISEIPASGKEARSLVPHRVSEVRQDSPAGRGGRLKVGDRVEGVDGCSITHLNPREITQLFKQAGSKIRLRILPKSETEEESISDAAEIEVDEKRTPTTPVTPGPLTTPTVGPKEPQPQPDPAQESAQYVVELHRGPTGFGFSLRGGSEYNMNIYVLGMMEGGPAQRSGKMQVSDRLMEINGVSTSGLSHTQAVEQIRSGGSKIRLLLSRGTGYVPDYDAHPQRSPSPESLLEAGARLEPRGPAVAHNAHVNREHHGKPRPTSEKPQSPADPSERTSPMRSGHQGDRREGRPRTRRSEVRGATLTPGASLGRNEELPLRPPRESKSLSPQRGRASGSRPPTGTGGLLGPRLRPSVEPGPWLVPSHERLSHTLRKDGALPRHQGTEGGFARGFWGMEAEERDKREALW